MICAIVLAAGLSNRMGVQKLLLPFGGKTVIGHIVDQLLTSTIGEVYVVVGHQAECISAELSGRAVTIVNNPNYESGMLSSTSLQSLPNLLTRCLNPLRRPKKAFLCRSMKASGDIRSYSPDNIVTRL